MPTLFCLGQRLVRLVVSDPSLGYCSAVNRQFDFVDLDALGWSHIGAALELVRPGRQTHARRLMRFFSKLVTAFVFVVKSWARGRARILYCWVADLKQTEQNTSERVRGPKNEIKENPNGFARSGTHDSHDQGTEAFENAHDVPLTTSFQDHSRDLFEDPLSRHFLRTSLMTSFQDDLWQLAKTLEQLVTATRSPKPARASRASLGKDGRMSLWFQNLHWKSTYH